MASCGYLRGDQRVQRQRGGLRLAPGAAQLHRVRHVDEQRDGGRGAALGLDDLEVLGRAGSARRRRRVLRSTALRTVRTTSSGCSSPNRHSRLAPVTSPAAPASRTSWPPRPRDSSTANTRLSAVCAEPAQRPRGQLEPVAAALAGSPGRAARARCGAAARGRRRRAAQRALDQLLVDVVEAGAGVVLAEQVVELVEVGQFGERAGGVGEAHRLVAVHPLPTAPAQVGTGRRAGPAAGGPSRRPGRPAHAPDPSGPRARRAARG